jgi:hypothetical protein
MGLEVVARLDGMRREGAGTSRLDIPGPSVVAHSTSSGMDSLPSIKITDLPSRKVSGFNTPWFVLTPDTVDTRAGHRKDGQGGHPRHPRPPVLGVRAAQSRVCAAQSRVRGSGARGLRRVQADKVEVRQVEGKGEGGIG